MSDYQGLPDWIKKAAEEIYAAAGFIYWSDHRSDNVKKVAEVIARNVQPSPDADELRLDGIMASTPSGALDVIAPTYGGISRSNWPARPVQQPAPNKFASGREPVESEQNKTARASETGFEYSSPSLRNEPLAISVQQPATEPLNINDRVYVRLTAKGIEAQKNHYLRLRLDPAKHIRPAQDGLWEFQLWELMSIFGTEMYMGNTPLFDKNEITLALREPAPAAGQSPTKFIGDVRRSLFLDVDDSWNGVVRDVTAKLEVHEQVDEAEVLKALAQHLRNQALVKGFAENFARDWAPLAKKLSAQLKSMGADVHPSKLEIWLEQNAALALRDVPQGQTTELKEYVAMRNRFNALRLEFDSSIVGNLLDGFEAYVRAARQVPVGPEGKK